MKMAKSQRRSCLFVPALNVRAMEKTLQLDVDAVIFDLEDSVSSGDKIEAHENLRNFFERNTNLPYYAAIRINPVIGNDSSELKFAASLKANALVLPKVENSDELVFIYATCKSIAKKPIPLWAMIETPKGILAAPAIASHPSITCLVVGPNDIALETGVSSTQDIGGLIRPFLIPWLMQIVLAAKASNRRVLDGVYNDYKDIDGFDEECRQAKAMGFDGKTLIHPNQIEASNRHFAPSKAEMAWAQLVVDTFALPENQGKGVIAMNGKMVEDLHLKQAKHILEMSKNIKNI